MPPVMRCSISSFGFSPIMAAMALYAETSPASAFETSDLVMTIKCVMSSSLIPCAFKFSFIASGISASWRRKASASFIFFFLFLTSPDFLPPLLVIFLSCSFVSCVAGMRFLYPSSFGMLFSPKIALKPLSTFAWLHYPPRLFECGSDCTIRQTPFIGAFIIGL